MRLSMLFILDSEKNFCPIFLFQAVELACRLQLTIVNPLGQVLGWPAWTVQFNVVTTLHCITIPMLSYELVCLRA
jgi:hypothetical protein